MLRLSAMAAEGRLRSSACLHPAGVSGAFGGPEALDPTLSEFASFPVRRFDTRTAECYSHCGLYCQSGSQTSALPKFSRAQSQTIAYFDWFNLMG